MLEPMGRAICEICGRDASPNGDNIQYHHSGPFVICHPCFGPESRAIVDKKHWAYVEQQAHEENAKRSPEVQDALNGRKA